ncbi:MAG TPA: HAMP domain-containing sensor histidine kinase [Candidatus Elarobacter sp.]|nr:HAMP domain-containing sensor histidine kinase [Candidatus Elarobacter sp.]
MVLLAALDAVAFWYLAGREHDLVEPLLGTALGQAAYAAALRRDALALLLLDLPLLLACGFASYVLAVFSVRPLLDAREREARFAAEAAHELRTPLARIASLAQTGRAGADSRARDDAFDLIVATALDASGTISDLLALVRDERVVPKLSEPVDVGAVARATVESAQHDGLDYELRVEDGCWVEGDERRLRRLTENLVDNASRHAQRHVSIGVARDERLVVLSVEDDGPGVPDDLRERVFERFVRADDDERGSGLGLAICRAIARAHGGDVVLEGRSCFVARLPRFVAN